MNIYIKFLYVKPLFQALNYKIKIKANNYHNFEVVMNVSDILRSLPKLQCSIKYLSFLLGTVSGTANTRLVCHLCHNSRKC